LIEEVYEMVSVEEVYKFIDENQPVKYFDIGKKFGTGHCHIIVQPGCYVAVELKEDVCGSLLQLLNNGTIVCIPCPGETSDNCQTEETLIATEAKAYEEDHWLPTFFATSQWLENHRGKYGAANEKHYETTESKYQMFLPQGMSFEKVKETLEFFNDLLMENDKKGVRFSFDDIIEKALAKLHVCGPDTRKATAIGFLFCVAMFFKDIECKSDDEETRGDERPKA
jgi:hypothetical protein